MANTDRDGSIYVEGHFIGSLEGFSFTGDPDAFGADSEISRADADRILAQEIKNRADELDQAEDGEFSLILGEPMIRSTLNWRGIALARIVRGDEILIPKAVVIPAPLLRGDILAQVQARADRWLNNYIGEILAPLFALREAVNGASDGDGKLLIDGMARDIASSMVAKLGTIPRRLIARNFRNVTPEGRFWMKQLGIWFGAASLYIPALLKPAPARLRLFLWALFNDRDRLPEIPVAGLCTIAIDPEAPRTFYEVCGYRVVGKKAVRLDMLERLANAAREISLKGPFPAAPDLMSLVGTSGGDFIETMNYLGYVHKEYSPEEAAGIAQTRAAGTAAEDVTKTEKTPPEEKQDTAGQQPEVPFEKIFLFCYQPNHKPHTDRARDNNVTPPSRPNKSKANKKPAIRKKSRPAAPPDPHSPFAALAGLKARLKSKNR